MQLFSILLYSVLEPLLSRPLRQCVTRHRTCMSRFISQVVLCGANRPYNVALIVPDWNAIRAVLHAHESVSDDELANDKRVAELMEREIHENCRGLKKFEIPQKWALVAPFTTANNMLTPKMSIRRHKVIQAYSEVISYMYDGESHIAEVVDSTRAQEQNKGESRKAA